MLGDPPSRLTDTAKVVAEAMEATLAAIRPGADGGAVHRAFDRVIRPHGLQKDSRIGYSIGIGYPPDWGERTVSLRPGETHRTRSQGMAFHVILGIWSDDWGYELSEPVVVTHSGAERLTDLPQELTDLEVTRDNIDTPLRRPRRRAGRVGHRLQYIVAAQAVSRHRPSRDGQPGG